MEILDLLGGEIFPWGVPLPSFLNQGLDIFHFIHNEPF